MANTQRGEISAVFDGEERTLCLTLGALAELEGRLGGGNAVSDNDLARMAIEGGLRGAAEIAARLLRATFGGEA